MQKRKSTVKVRRKREPISRRRAMATIAAGTGALLLSGSSLTRAEDDDTVEDPGEGPRSQYLSWEDGWAYPLWGYTDEGQWVVEFDDGFYIVDPAGWVFDLGVWYAIVDASGGEVWYSGDDTWDYCLEHDLEYECIDDDDYNCNGDGGDGGDDVL